MTVVADLPRKPLHARTKARLVWVMVRKVLDATHDANAAEARARHAEAAATVHAENAADHAARIDALSPVNGRLVQEVAFRARISHAQAREAIAAARLHLNRIDPTEQA